MRKAIEDYVKPHGAQTVEYDIFHSSPDVPDKAYVGVTVTYNFATAEGKQQREFLGVIVKKEGDAWAVERLTTYTKDSSRAGDILAGGK